jgi:non-specific serine/threonine protein kinase
MAECEAVTLFVDRIRHAEPDFALSGGTAASVAQICERLDGIPLALELAAALGGAMSVQDIAARLDDCFHLLTGGSRAALPRQRTLRATIDWSHELLAPAERTLFRRLAVFAGGWTLDAAEAVCTEEPLTVPDIPHLLTRLVDQSLVSLRTQAGHSRYRFLETVRAYAAESLQASGELPGMQARQRNWCLAFVEHAARELNGPNQLDWFRRLAAEEDNVRAALDTSAADPSMAEIQLRLAVGMGRFWFPRKPDEGRRRIAQALERAAAPSAVRSALLRIQGYFEFYYGEPAVAQELARRALADGQELSDAYASAVGLRLLAHLTPADDAATRVELLEEGLMLARASGNAQEIAWHFGWLGAAVAEKGDLRRARELLEESERVARSIGDTYSGATPVAQLGWLAIAEGRLDDAEARFQSLLDLVEGGWGGAHGALGLLGLGQVRLRQGNVEQARGLYRRVLSDLCESSPGSLILADTLAYMASVEAAAGLDERAQRLIGAHEGWYAAHGGIGIQPNLKGPLNRGLVPLPSVPTDEELARARAEGRGMTVDQAAMYALESAETERTSGVTLTLQRAPRHDAGSA